MFIPNVSFYVVSDVFHHQTMKDNSANIALL